MKLPSKYLKHYGAVSGVIEKRLAEFRVVPPQEYIYEAAFCLLTPQSRAANAEQVITKLRRAGYPHKVVEPTIYLRDPAHYIRFHNQKSKRLIALAQQKDSLCRLLSTGSVNSFQKRQWLVENINGLGWKEASHFLRNIGYFDVGIIDRHILKHLLQVGMIDNIPVSAFTQKSYLALESKFFDLANKWQIPLQELDLLLWSMEEGSVRK